MYDAFKDVIWKELGLLDPNWFEVQATQASLDEGNGVDSFDLRANQEGIFKTPLEKTATESQLFSTPKVFRHSRIVSPDTEDEPPFIVAHEKETLPWMATQSPCLFQPSKQSVSDVKCEGVQAQSEESFDFLATPKKSPDTYVKHISESLGAHINPDISWTSSLNTPPGLPGSTLILSKKDESPCPVNVTAERNGFLVRKLFPSLSNSSPKTWKKSAVSSSSQSAVFPVADGCPESPLNQSESHWQQKVPDAVAGEEEVCSADGAETVPSNFFANSSSALRKVKLNRVKRKQIIQTNVDVCVHGDVSKADNGASSEEAAAEMESGALPSTPQVKTGYTAISQWSPLNLSQISSCAVGSSMTSPAVTDSDQVTKPSVKTTDSGFIRKKRTFVYAVAATKSQAQCQDSEFQKMDPSPKISDSGFHLEQEVNTKSLENTPGKAESQRTKNQNEFAGEPKTQFVGSKLQDVDMSQLCRDFAQDFSQMTDVKLAEGTQSNFSPAACLSAMKQAKQKAKQANLPNDHSNNRHIPTSSITEETMTDSGLQSGIADVTHETSLSFALSCLEKVGQNGHLFDVKTKMHNFRSTTGSGNEKVDAELPLQGSRKGQTLDHGKETNLHMESTSTRQSRSRDKTVDESNCAEPAGTPVSLLFSNESGFKTASNKGIHISPANLERAKRLLEETEDAKTFRDHSCKTYHAVKYKGNSSPETMKNIPTNSTQPLRVEKSFGNISSQLTASEKADVKELCVLLEEADSQFEFTQFKPAKIMQNGQDDHNPPEKQDKDLDPAFLADIDFDDSFSSDGGKQPAVAVVSDKTTSVSESITNEEAAKATNHYTEMSVSNLLKKENSSLDSLSESITEDRICLKSVEPDILPQTEGTEASVLENNSTLTHGETFRTAGGSVLKVSKKCLSKARALFADLENNLTDQKPSDKQNRGNASKTEQKCDIDSDVCGKDLGFTLKETCDVGKEIDNCFSKLDGVACSNKNVPSVGDKSDGKSLKNNQIDTTACESGFRRASGKGISISAKYMQEAEAFFKDCHAMGHGEDKKIKALPESAASKKSFTNFKSPQVSISKESVAGCAKFENVNAALIAHHTKGLHLAEVETKSRFTAALKHEDGKPFSTSKPFAVLRTSNSMASSALENVCSGDGFCTAAGKNICVSAAAMRKAESLLNHIQTPEEINTQANQRELTSKTKGLHDEMSKLDNGCFETVGGKENKISSTAQKKAALLREYEKPEDEISVSPQHTDPEIPVTNLWSGGFLAASGKPVVLSSEALEKAKALFSDISLNMDNLSETAPGKRDRKPEEDQSNAEMLHSGFATAGAAKDHVSQKNILNARDHLKECDDLVLVKAMEEEDALFTDCDLGSNAMLASAGSKKGDLENPFPDQRIGINISEDAGKRCFRETNEQKQKENLLPQASCGFKTASGGRVDVSFEALKRAQTLLGDCVGVDKVNAAPPESKAVAFPIRNGGFQSASGKPVVLSSEALRKAKSLFSDIGLSAEDPIASQTRKICKNQDGGDNTETIWCGFTSARGERVDVSKKNLQKAQVLFKELDDLASTKAMQEEDAFFADCDAGISDEMLEKDTKGKANPRKHYQEEMRVDISAEAGCSWDVDRVEQNEKILPQASRGFQTASGKRVDVSSEALKRAQTLLGDCVGVEDKVNAAPPESKAIAFPIRKGGFQSASGKPVVLSSEALRKAKSLFSDIGLSAEDPIASQTRKICKNQDGGDNTETIWCGFTSARGERVDVSKKNLQKAQVLFKELDDLASTKAMQEEDAFFADCDAGISDEMLEKDTKGKANPRKHYQEEMRVDISSEAGCSWDVDRVEQNEKILPQASRGFQTASGKRVDVSSEALKRAQTLLGDCVGVEDKVNAAPPESKAIAFPIRKGGFQSASGKPVVLSSEALRKAKSLFSDIGLSAEDPNASQTRKSCKNQDGGDNTETIWCGFTSARGERVDVSKKNLQKAQVLFKELDDLASTKAMQEEDAFFADCDAGISDEMLEKDTKGKANPIKHYQEEMRVDISMEAGCSRDADKRVEQNEKTLPQASRGFQTASGKRVDVSSEALKRAKTLLNEFEGLEDKTNTTALQSKATARPLRNVGFHSASGKPVALSTEAVEKAKSLFGDITFSAEDPDSSQTMKTDGKQDSRNETEKICCGFTTARGEKVSVSQKNIQTAKFLFKELDDLSLTRAMQETDNFFTEEGWTTDGKSEINQTNKAPVNESGSAKRNVFQLTPDERETGRICEDPENGLIKATEKEGSSMPAPNGGFHTASGKTVAVSCEALSRAKLLLSESKTDEERTSLPLSQTPINDPVLTNGGFSAASGKPLMFSSESLQKAKTLFGNISLSAALPHRGEEKREGAQNEEKVKCALTNVEATNPVNSEIPNLRDPEGTSTPKSSLTSANRKKHSGVESRPTASSEGQRVGFVVCDLNTESSINTFKVKGTDESSDPKLQSLNLAGCTETQEALDCMEALLEDEFLVGQNLLTTSDLLQQPEEQKSNCTSTEESRTRKRRCAEDLTAHPPSKRRLLEDFGRTTDGPSGSGLHSVKICPYGLMDRGVFKYSASLHPNVTKPPWDAKTFVDTRFQATTQTRRSDPGGDRSAPSKMPAFVPPFIRNTKRDIPNKPEAADRKKAPAFVPPFKKHRSVPPVSSAKQQDNGLSSECDSKTDAPGSTADVVPSADSANTSMTINQSVPGSVGPVSATETLHTDGVLSRSQDGTQNIELARDMQDMRIRKKKRQTIRPLPGSLFLTKTSGVMRIPLRAAVNGKNPERYSARELYECGVHTQVPEVTGANAESFRFNLLQFIKQETLSDGGGVQLADGGWLIPSNDWTAGKEEFYRALCDTAGVDPKLISEQWVYNHYRWIVWKQASMERSFPAAMGSLCLTPEQVLLQLKYRYDVEVDHSRRPALRKIMERDDTPAKTLVLCVCDVVCRGHSLSAQSRSNTKTTQSAETKAETPFAVIWLTDGWYAIKAQLDEPLTAMLHKGLLAVGGKLMIHGAQLVGSQDACSPLEAPDSLMLKICGNSTRRARWDAKLGFHRDPRPFLLPISCLFSNGGPVGCVDIIVLRSYPMQWMERKSDGGVVFRSARAEEKEARRFDIHKQKAIERLFAKVQAEFEKEEEGSMKPQRRRQTISKQDLANLQDGVELYEAVGDDPAYLEAHLSEQQMESLQAYRRSLMEKKQAALQERYRRALDAEDSEMSCPKRDVTPVWRLCVADSTVQSSCVYQLNLWRPSSDLQSLLKEGCRFKVYNLVASDGKKRSSVDTVQLTGTKNTKFQELQAPQEWLSSRFQQRVSTDFVDLQNEEFKPLCGDVDLAGYVISVIDQQGSSPAFYLVDGKLDFVKVRCFSSLSQAGLEDVVKPRVLLALSNLQLRGQSMYPTPVVYAGDLTAFSTNPKEIHLQEAMYQLKNMVQCQDNFFRAAEDKLAHLVKSDDVRSPSLRQQTPASATDRRQDSKTSVSFQRPVKSLGSFTPVSSNVPAAPSSAEKDPKILKRRRALDYLSRIPSPPPVSPLASAVSPCVKKTFNPPRRSGPPSTLNPVQTAAPKPSDAAVEGDWVNDEELAMIDTQALHVGSLF